VHVYICRRVAVVPAARVAAKPNKVEVVGRNRASGSQVCRWRLRAVATGAGSGAAR